MHMQLLRNNKVVIFDRTDFGSSNLTLPAGKCRFNDEAIAKDCSAHSLLYDVASNTYRPLMVETDVWCSSGAVNSDGTLIQTGGYHAGDRKIRVFTPCDDERCDWVELPHNLTVQRWYSSDQILPDGRVIIVGGRSNIHNNNKAGKMGGAFYLPFLKETTDPKEENNLYPFLHLLPDGNLFVFANQRSVILDYKKNRILKEFPVIPGEKRTYPATGSSVMLPLRLTSADPPPVEIMVCGGARGGAYLKASKGVYVAASRSCGRIRVTDRNPKWEMEDMLMGRVMPDMLLLPTGDVIILNGAGKGTAGWESAEDPVLNPLLYNPYETDPNTRFTVLSPTRIARMYHSAAILLPDGRILVGGSNPHVRYNFTGVKYPTELSLEAFSPPYLAPVYAHLRPSILSVEGPSDNTISYGQQFAIIFGLGLFQPAGEYIVTLVAPSFTTHSFAMNQRLLVLHAVRAEQLSALAYKVTVDAPTSANIAPPGYYMLFVVHRGVPCQCVWIRIR
ncbi:galactose oxidase [Phtheirospermum japonicum]|uniref:Galactose oxidase n=1 Tax=Phtheirospermum japonicum TaxID=374723 RepID=A0A830BD91_9LAMI|nr:galactose oxidase [Phtheirospermum japonicum]